MSIHLSPSDPSVKLIIKATFPEFRGRSVVAEPSDQVHFHSTQWDEGYKRDYRILNLDTLQSVGIPEAPFLQRSELHEKTFTDIPDRCVVVVYCRSRKDRIEIIGPTSNITPLLPAPVVLTDDERTVLMASVGFKSSYQGHSNFRFYQANRSTGITLERYNAAKQALIGKKYLNKAGAATDNGRNAIGSARL